MSPLTELVAKREGDAWSLRSPSPGFFIPAVGEGAVVVAGQIVGTLDVLGRRLTLIAPDVSGMVVNADEDELDARQLPVSTLGARSVGYNTTLLVLHTSKIIGRSAATADLKKSSATTMGLVFRAPTSGRFYSRSTPGKPAFVAVGDELGPGATVCLLEVMKTFNRVTYGGPGLPERAKVTAILVADGADVTAGDPLLQLA